MKIEHLYFDHSLYDKTFRNYLVRFRDGDVFNIIINDTFIKDVS